jgi:spore germination protein GerM
MILDVSRNLFTSHQIQLIFYVKRKCCFFFVATSSSSEIDENFTSIGQLQDFHLRLSYATALHSLQCAFSCSHVPLHAPSLQATVLPQCKRPSLFYSKAVMLSFLTQNDDPKFGMYRVRRMIYYSESPLITSLSICSKKENIIHQKLSTQSGRSRLLSLKQAITFRC